MREREKVLLVALVSDGTKLPALWNYRQIHPEATLHLAISNKETSKGFVFAKEKGIPMVAEPWDRESESRADYSEKLAQRILTNLPYDTEGNIRNDYLVVSAGQPYILTAAFYEKFLPNRLINFHPGLLPDNPDDSQVLLSNGETVQALRGLYDHKLFSETLRLGLKWAGVTVHYLTGQVDSGGVIKRGEVPVLPGDTVKTLARKVHAKEDEIMPEALDLAIAKI